MIAKTEMSRVFSPSVLESSAANNDAYIWWNVCLWYASIVYGVIDRIPLLPSIKPISFISEKIIFK